MANKNSSKITPMIKQYLEIKNRHKSEILFFRMGDFYEMFFEDAKTASKILDITLTSRQDNIPMCGIPHHAADNYLVRLVKAGKRVAICEQLESVPSSGTIVKRDVVRIITPGTVIESNMIKSDDNNFLASIIIDEKDIGFSFVDISTGDFFLYTIKKSLDAFRGEIKKFSPNEIVIKHGSEDNLYLEYIENSNIQIYKINDWYYDIDFMINIITETFKTVGVKGLGIDSDLEIMSAGSIIQYLIETQKKKFEHLKHPKKINFSDIMILDESTISNLELITNTHDGTKNRTLFSVLNNTKTAMGRRLLERNILQPLLKQEDIELRYDYIEYFFENIQFTQEIQEILNESFDIERLISRFNLAKISPRNFLGLLYSIEASRKLKLKLDHTDNKKFSLLTKLLPDLIKLEEQIKTTIDPDPAISPEQGRVIKTGFNAELDRLYSLKSDAKSWILEYQDEEKKRLKIPTLKIKYNRILSYYIEVSKAQASNIPEDYIRKQTLVSSERFTTEKLQEFESEILTASDKIVQIEKEEIEKLKNDILLRQKEIQDNASFIAEIDFLISLSISALENKFIRPEFNNEKILKINSGRHPVVEKYFTTELFIPNDISFDNDENLIKIITGPNMSGKSTYIRMAAIIQLMAQAGSFIPAKSANLSICDRIFTRIGASDNISRGESTFLVEMNETANILNNATDKSLIIMDEVGRGTSTYDGLSIAWAIVEFILGYLKAKTMFATHYHELTQLENKTGIVNYNVLVQEDINSVNFLHKVIKGAADKSYGIHVANLAGIPKQIINKASKLLEKLEKKKKQQQSKLNFDDNDQLEIFNASNHVIIQAIKSIDIDNLSPIDALNELNRLKSLLQ